MAAHAHMLTHITILCPYSSSHSYTEHNMSKLITHTHITTDLHSKGGDVYVSVGGDVGHVYVGVGWDISHVARVTGCTLCVSRGM